MANYAKYDLSNVKYVGIGGTPSTKEQLELIFQIFPNAAIVHTYGMTETSGTVTVFDTSAMDRSLMAKKMGSIGKLCPGFSCKIVDLESGKNLGANCKGEIRLKTPFSMNGYYNRDSSEAWDEEGWLCTGDVGFYDEDDFLYIVDRIKDMLKFQYWHVTPSAIEAILLQHPLVKEAVVIGIPHEVDGDLAMGIVVLTEDEAGKNDMEMELVDFVADKMEFRDRLHGGLKIVESIPRTPSGKCRRRDLRIMILEGKL